MSEPTPVLLNPPPVTRVRYKRNFIKTAVCELRFPTLLELEARPPREFQRKIRKQYPFYEAQIIDMSGGDEVGREHRYLFRDKNQHWTVSVKSFALGIETSSYTDFEDFFKRFKQILGSARAMIDADFFTRVGLRYINHVPIEDGKVDGWIRGELIAPLTSGVFGDADKFVGFIQGNMDGGQYTIRHGLRDVAHDRGKKTEPTTATAPVNARDYQLDFDYFSENVEFDNVESLVEKFNATNFALFSWCLGEKAQKLLGEGKKK